MVKPSPKTWCTVTPSFPKTAYVSFALIQNVHNVLCYVPGHYLEETVNACLKTHLLSKTSLEKQDIYLDPISRYLKVLLNRLLPLRREHWTRNHKDILTNTQIYSSFIDLMNHPTFYQLIVLPEGMYRKKWYLKPVLAVPQTATDEILDQLMFGIESPVDETAKYAAVYDVCELRLYNSEEKQWFSQDQPAAISDKIDSNAKGN